MPYRQDIYTGPYVKEIIFTRETEHASGLVLPRPVAHLRLAEVAQESRNILTRCT